MIKLVIKLAIVALVAHAGVKIVPVFWANLRFKDALAEQARFAGRKSEEELRGRAERIANDLEIPVTGETITIHKAGTTTSFDTHYTAQLEYFPRRFYPWEFTIHVEEKPPEYSNYLP
jgi:hypothetical protein